MFWKHVSVKSSAPTVPTYLKLILRLTDPYNIPLPEAFLLDLNFPVSAIQYDCKIVFPVKFQRVIFYYTFGSPTLVFRWWVA